MYSGTPDNEPPPQTVKKPLIKANVPFAHAKENLKIMKKMAVPILSSHIKPTGPAAVTHAHNT